VIQDFQAGVNDITWIESSDVNCIIAGCSDGVVGMWHVMVDRDRCEISLKWKTMSGELDLKDATIQDVQGLSQLSRKLLTQRGAVGEPAHRLREAGKMVATMASVISGLKTPLNNAVEGSSFTNSTLIKELEHTIEHRLDSLEQRFQQTKDSLFQDVRAVVEKSIHTCE
jgi:hypothetical protein